MIELVLNGGLGNEDPDLQIPLIELTKHCLRPNASILGHDIARICRREFTSFISAFPTSKTDAKVKPALDGVDNRKPIGHSRVREFCYVEFPIMLAEALRAHDGYPSVGPGDRVALALPNGPELALAILACVQNVSCVPVNICGAGMELEADLCTASCKVVIGPGHGRDGHDRAKIAADNVGIPFIELVPSKLDVGIFELVSNIGGNTYGDLEDEKAEDDLNMTDCTSLSSCAPALPRPNNLHDEVLILFTSGTTGRKKLVPHSLENMLVASACISISWALTPGDVNCNLMPLFHVGGIVRQLFASILSGGCVICCPEFDPVKFWMLMREAKFTWYYASPTMHQVVLQTGKDMGFVCETTRSLMNIKCKDKSKRLRMIANAAGGLSPSLALELRNTFQANILPSYGMTECMPISSPPASYCLERAGTSGVAVGPEIAILNEYGTPFPIGKEGSICVRGPPLMYGYGNVGYDEVSSHDKCFLNGGWFNTGDIGYLDKDGYLFITGRAKEVINRGGEIISPLEVEEAVLSHPSVQSALAFSVRHDILQEVVGVVVVCNSNEGVRFDLPGLHKFLGERLKSAKWPQCLVFMDALPRSYTKKLQRVNLEERLGLSVISDSTPYIMRTFEANCPPLGSNSSIVCQAVEVQPEIIQEALLFHLNLNNFLSGVIPALKVVPHPSRYGLLICYVHDSIDRGLVVDTAERVLNAYLIPQYFIYISTMFGNGRPLPPPNPNTDTISAIRQGSKSISSNNAIAREIQEMWMDLLQLECAPRADANFFYVGGSSLLASQLAVLLRKRFSISISGANIFHHSTPAALANLVNEFKEKEAHFSSCKDFVPIEVTKNQKRIRTENNFASKLIQILPLMCFYPFFKVLHFFCFLLTLSELLNRSGATDHPERSLICVIISIGFAWLLSFIFSPMLAIVIKWIVIGRYRAGRYPIWSNYYLRWWIVDWLNTYLGKGMFGLSKKSLNLYYRLMGAAIGKDVSININCDIAEYDLIYIGDGASIDAAVIRGFALDNGCMLLGHIFVGFHASVGLSSVVAPNVGVPSHNHLGPASTSYDLAGMSNTSVQKLNRSNYEEPHFMTLACVGYPVKYLVGTICALPEVALIYHLLCAPWRAHELKTLIDTISWFMDPRRIPFFFGLRIIRGIVTPLLNIAASVLIKRFFIGPFRAGSRELTQKELLRHWLMERLCSRETISDASLLVGKHYKGVSWIYRLLGAKVGERVFWSGSSNSFSGEFDLLEIGDDVVFGSRSTIQCSTKNTLEPVRICAGANVADTCILLPGCNIGKNAVLGSSSIAPHRWYLPEASVWFGSKGSEPIQLDKGSKEGKECPLQLAGDVSTLRPFGDAFYNRKATYFVWPLSLVIIMSITISVLRSTLHAMPMIAALQLAKHILFYWHDFEDFADGSPEILHADIFLALIISYNITHLGRILLWFCFEVCGKWAMVGHRKAGNFNWNTSSYPQRWSMYTTLTSIRNSGGLSMLDFFNGTPYMVYFFKALGCRIGKNVCLYPTGCRHQPMMSEPDLVEIGEGSVIDDAAIVCHLNTKGNFSLVPIQIGAHVTMRKQARIQQGGVIKSGSMVLERSLVMTGDVIEQDDVWLGSPAQSISMSKGTEVTDKLC